MLSSSPWRRARSGTIALLATFFVCCDSDPVEPLGPGQVQGLLISPHNAEGAAVFSLSGPGVSGVEVDDGTAFVESGGGLTRLVIVLEEPGDIMFRVTVAERSQLPDVTVVEVADGDNQLRERVSSYRVDFTLVSDPAPSVAAAVR